MYTFYSEGFFGYGEPGTFQPYSLMHFLPILLTIGLLVLVWFQRERLRAWPGEIHLRFVWAFVMMLVEMGYYWRLLYVGDEYGTYLLLDRLPLQVCEWGLFCCMFMMPSKSKILFGINFFVTLVGAGIACIIPQTVLKTCGPAHFRYYQYWGEHLLPIAGTIYMMIVHRMRPRYRDLWISVGSLALLAIPCIIANEAIPGSNYMYLNLEVSFLPQNQYLRALIYFVLITLLFHLLWLVWKLVEKAIDNRLQRKKAAA